MKMLVTLAAGCLAISIRQLFLGIKEKMKARKYPSSEEVMREKEKREEQQLKEITLENMGTRDLVLETLTKLGCQPKEAEDGRIIFEYQGITFLIEATNDCYFVNLIWPWCHSCSKFDIDEFARVRQVINEINMQGSATVFYGISDSDDVAVHIKKHFLFVPQIPQLDEYLKLTLNSFFRTARTLDVEIEKCRLQDS